MVKTFETSGDGRVGGDLLYGGVLRPDVVRSNLAKETGAIYPVPLTQGRVWDAMASLLPSAGAADDLGLIGGTFATGVPSLQTGDVKNTTGTRYARYTLVLPPEYDAGTNVKIRLSAGMKTTVATVSCTADVEVYKSARDALITGSDLCTTAATSINSLTFADKDFTITASGLSPGDILDVRLAIIWNDAQAAVVVNGCIGSFELVCDIRG